MWARLRRTGGALRRDVLDLARRVAGTSLEAVPFCTRSIKVGLGGIALCANQHYDQLFPFPGDQQ